MVDAIACACADAHAHAHAHAQPGADLGNVKGKSKGDVPSVRQEDIISLAEAQKMTSMYAKMEYGVKRLLWLGG